MSGRAALKMGGLPSMKRGSRVPLVPTYRASTRYLPANLALQRQVPVLRIRRAQVVGQCQVRDPERKGAWREGIRRSEEGVSKGGTRNAKGRKKYGVHLARLKIGRRADGRLKNPPLPRSHRLKHDSISRSNA